MGNCFFRRHQNRLKSQNIEIKVDAKSTHTHGPICRSKSNDYTPASTNNLPDDITFKPQHFNDNIVLLQRQVHADRLTAETNVAEDSPLFPLQSPTVYLHSHCGQNDCKRNREYQSEESWLQEIQLEEFQSVKSKLREPQMGESQSEKSQLREPQLEKLCSLPKEISVSKNDKISLRFNPRPTSTTRFTSKTLPREETIRQSTEYSVDSGIVTRETSFSTDTLGTRDKFKNSNHDTYNYSNDDKKDINNINICNCQQSLTTLQEKEYKLFEDRENDNDIDFKTDVSDSSEQSSTINSTSSVLFETKETFSENRIQTFNHTIGQKYCTDCADHLDIPDTRESQPEKSRLEEIQLDELLSLTSLAREQQLEELQLGKTQLGKPKLEKLYPNPLFREKPACKNSKIPSHFNPISTIWLTSKILPQEEMIRQSTEYNSVDSGIVTRETSFSTDTLGTRDKFKNSNHDTYNYSNDDKKDINNINVCNCQQSLTTLQEKEYKLFEDRENDNDIDFKTDVSDSSEQSSTINSTSSVLFETNEAFSEDIIQTFNHTGGQMYCCKDCADHLDIPAGAIAGGTEYEIIQQFPFISCQDETKCGYHVLCVKEFRERRNRSFERHVRIVNHFTSDLYELHIKVRYSTDKGNYKEAYFKSDNSEVSFAHDVYFTVRNSVLTIFTTHFTVFIVEESIQSSPKNIFSKNPKQRYVDLVALAYFSVDFEERKVLLHTYIQDIRHKKYKENKKDIESRESKCAYGCYFEETKLTGLPDIIKRSTDFQCLLFLCRSKWKKMLSTETFELEEMLDADAIFLNIDRTSALGKVSYNEIRAGDILNCKTNVQPLLGDFKLKYDEAETVFAPITIIKTFTRVFQTEENQPMQQSFFIQVSISRVNCDEVNLIQSAISDVKKRKLSEGLIDPTNRWAKGLGYWKLCDQNLIANEEEYADKPQTKSNVNVIGLCDASYKEIFIEPRFHGLLSDRGLFQLADNIGADWNELACTLKVPFALQDRLERDHHGNTRKQTVNMLRWWRDRQENDKSIVKDTLHDALLSIGKSDIASQLMKEQIEGSIEDIPNKAF